MEYIPIPHLQKVSSRIGLGTWAIGGWMWGGTDEKASIETIERALDLGINLIDTAPVYGLGHCEETVGKALKNSSKRDRVILATKAGLGWKEGKIYRDARKDSLFKELELSLKRLGVEHIDLYQLHWPDPKTPVTEAAEALSTMLQEGKIGAVGVSNLSKKQMEEFQKVTPIHSLQSPFNLFERGIEEKELAYCKERGIATLGYGVLCRGLLSGKMDKNRQFMGDDIRKIDPKFQEPVYSSYLNAAKHLSHWAEAKHKKSLSALAVRWSLDKGISTSLWGARRPEQLDPIEGVWHWNLSKDDFAEIDAILTENLSAQIGPEFMAPPARDKAA